MLPLNFFRTICAKKPEKKLWKSTPLTGKLIKNIFYNRKSTALIKYFRKKYHFDRKSSKKFSTWTKKSLKKYIYPIQKMRKNYLLILKVQKKFFFEKEIENNLPPFNNQVERVIFNLKVFQDFYGPLIQLDSTFSSFRQKNAENLKLTTNIRSEKS